MGGRGTREHAAGRRPGRTQRIAYDATPLASRTPDIDARVGWLLAMSRLHHPDPCFADGRRFVEALAEVGFPTSRSLISRWESGEIPASYEGLSAYERALQLREGRLASITGYIRAAIPGVRAKVVRPQLDVTTRDFAIRLDELIDCAEDGAAVARDWLELGWHLGAVPLVHLRGATWERVARQLVSLLPRSVKVPYRLYSTAGMNIATVPRAQDHLVDAVEAYVAQPDVQVVNTPLGLLDRLPTPKAARIVLDAIEEPRGDSMFSMAVWLAAQKLQRGDFSPEDRSRLEMIVLRLWRRDAREAEVKLAELIAGLPEGMRAMLADAARKSGRGELGYVIEHGEQMAPEVAGHMSDSLAEAARAGAPGVPTYAEDRMLPRLLREVLFHRDSQRRHLAALIISASPFSDPVTDALLEMLTDLRCPVWLRARAATTIRYLGGESHRLRMLRFTDDPDEEVAVPVIQAIGHLPFNELSDQALRTSLGTHWSPREQAKMYALGMTASPALDPMVRSERTPQWKRAAARWWLDAGPAVTS